MNIFDKIERILKQRQITTRALISAIGITPPGYYGMVKSGEIKLSTLENICTYLRIDIKELLTTELSEVNNLSIVSEPQTAYTAQPQSKNLNNQLILKDIAHIETLLNNIKNSLPK